MRSLAALVSLVAAAGCALVTGKARKAEPEGRGWAHVQYDRCKAGDDAMCIDLLHSHRSFSEAFRPQALEAGEIACARDNFEACRYLVALMPHEDRAGKLAARQALCQRGDVRGCEEAIRDMRYDGQSAASVVPYVFAACELDPTHYMCGYPLQALAKGEWSASAAERRRAFEFGACGPHRVWGTPADMPMSCDAKIATLHLGMRDGYKDAFVDYEVANQLLDRACTAGDAYACGRLGLNVFTGTGTERDVKTGLAQITEACAAGDRPACYARALVLLDPATKQLADDRPAQARAAFERVCDEHGPCFTWTASLMAQRGHRKTALQLAERGCDLGSRGSCRVAGRLGILLRQRDNPHIDELVQACSEDDERSCRALAYAYRKGYGVKASKKMARLFYNAAEDQTFRSKWVASMKRAGTERSRPIDEANAWVSLLMPYSLPLMAALNPKANWNFENEGFGQLPERPPFPVLPAVEGMPRGPVPKETSVVDRPLRRLRAKAQERPSRRKWRALAATVWFRGSHVPCSTGHATRACISPRRLGWPRAGGDLMLVRWRPRPVP